MKRKILVHSLSALIGLVFVYSTYGMPILPRESDYNFFIINYWWLMLIFFVIGYGSTFLIFYLFNRN